jgi:hypothetical protein
LPKNAVKMGCASGFKLQRGFTSPVIEPVQCTLIFFGGDSLIQDIFAPARGNKEKDMVGDSDQGYGQVLDPWDFVKIGLGDGRVDVKFYARIFCQTNASKRTFKGAVHTPEPVMAFRGGAVPADAYSSNPGMCHLLGDIFRDQRTVGRHHHAESCVGAGFCDIKNVGSQQRLAAAGNDDGFSDLCDLVQQAKTFMSVEFSTERTSCRRCAAVDAGKVAVARGFPCHQMQGLALAITSGMRFMRCRIVLFTHHVFTAMRIKIVSSFEINRFHWSLLSAKTQQERASGVIKFLAGSCLSGLGLVLKEP